MERRGWVLRQMMPPENRTVSELAEETGIETERPETNDPMTTLFAGEARRATWINAMPQQDAAHL